MMYFRGFDIGAMISNLLLSYFSQHATNGPQHADWILEQIIILYDTFSSEFIKLWNERSVGTGTGNGDKNTGGGELYKGDLYATKSVLTQAQVRHNGIINQCVIVF
jgi:5-methylthioribose kinase